MDAFGFASSRGKIAYVRAGTAHSRRILFIHGLCGNRTIFEPQMERFQSEFEVVGVDCLGHGGSAPVAPDRLISDSSLALQELARSFEPKSTIFVGHSFGGMIVNDLIRAFGTDADYAFVDSPCLYDPAQLEGYRAFRGRILSAPDPARFVRDWFSEFVSLDCAPDVRGKVVDAVNRFHPAWLAEVMAATPAPLRAPIDESAAPSVLVAEGAQCFPEGNDFSWLRFYPRAARWKYGGAGHFFFLEDPGPFNAALAAFAGSDERKPFGNSTTLKETRK